MNVLDHLKKRVSEAEEEARRKGAILTVVENFARSLSLKGAGAHITYDDGHFHITFPLPGMGDLPVAEETLRQAEMAANPPCIKEEPAPQDEDKPHRTGPFSDAENTTIIEMAAEGKSAQEIAAHLNRLARHVANKIQNYLAEEIEDHRAGLEVEREQREADATLTDRPTPERAAPASGEYVNRFDLHGLSQTIDRRLTKLGYAGKWTAQRDFQLAGILVRGEGLSRASAALSSTAYACRERWLSINARPGSLDYQEHLMKVLRLRADAEGAGA